MINGTRAIESYVYVPKIINLGRGDEIIKR